MLRLIFYFLFLSLLVSCGSGGSGGSSSGSDQETLPVIDSGYVVFAWNDLGMHCLNTTYDEMVILPPYNTVYAQVVKKGVEPEIITNGIYIEYRLINNTYSSGKTDAFGGDFEQFWDNVLSLFGVSLEEDKGLNLIDSEVSNGLSGRMAVVGDHFVAEGIPAVPVDDDLKWDPYQVAEITVKSDSGTVLARTRATVPTSDEINCAKSGCHGSNPFADILADHDSEHGTDLTNNTPVLCASCHGSPALGASDGGDEGYLSKVIHDSHKNREAECYDCHPGNQTKCSRSLRHNGNDTDGNCTTCHGTMAEVASSIELGRTPWLDEPKCSSCHNRVVEVAEVDTGNTLYRNARGHGNLFCTACHGSPHAMVPSREFSDNYQALQYMGKAVTMGSCAACHGSSKGDDEFNEFADEHGGLDPDKLTSCHVCHTAISDNTEDWPHEFEWKDR